MNAEERATSKDKVQDLRSTLFRAAKASETRRFHAVYDKVYRKDILAYGWQEVRANRGKPGIDGQSIEEIERSGVEPFLAELADELRNGTYRAQPVRRVYIPKSDGTQRGLGIPTVRDSVVQAAAKAVLEPIFEADFRESSYGFRPERDAHQAGEAMRKAVNRGGNWVLDADIRASFDRVDHTTVKHVVGKRVSDRRMLELLKQWLRAGVMENGVVTPTTTGVPQGGIISPLLANVVLHELDTHWEDHCRHLGQLIRYADDFVIVCETEAEAQEAYRTVEACLTGLRRELHPEKSRVVKLWDGSDGIDFLGFHRRKVTSWRYRGKRYLMNWPSRQRMQRARARVRAIIAGRTRLSEPIEGIVAELNRYLRGWGAYFRRGNSSKQLEQMDRYVRESLGMFVSRRAKRSGRGLKRNAASLAGLGVYQLSGTVTWRKATPKA